MDNVTAPSLDEIGILHGTDKSSLRQNYLVHYERLFANMRSRDITLIEIGVYNGASLETWESYFERETVVGIDIDPSCKKYEGGRRVVHVGSQTDAAFLDRVLDLHPKPGIVIDDGSHRHADIVSTFERLFPRLSRGGCYVVEDFDAALSSLAQQFGGTATCNAVEYFGAMHMTLMSRYEVATRDAARLWSLVLRSARPESWMYLAEYLMNAVGDYDAALKAVAIGIERMPSEPWLHVRAGQIFERKGDYASAVAAARRAGVSVCRHRMRVGGTLDRGRAARVLERWQSG